jgi:hemolysin activation/secretion protein
MLDMFKPSDMERGCMRDLAPLLVGSFVFLTSHVCAQSGYDPKQIPTYDAGALSRQAEQTLKQNQLQRSARLREAYPPVMVLSDQTTVKPKVIKFLGARQFTPEQLQTTASPYLNRDLTRHELNQLTEAVVAAYRQEGWIVRAYIPQQDLSRDDLTVQILENLQPSAR